MESRTDGESAIQIIAQAKAAGFEVSDYQLHRWYRAGVLPKPMQNWEKGKPGSEAIYPNGTGDQLCALCRIKTGRRSPKQWGWELWWLGFSVDRNLWRDHLEKWAIRHDRVARQLLTLLNDQEDRKTSSQSFTERLRGMRTKDVLFRQLRKRLGKRHLARFLGLVAQILQDDFQKWSVSSVDDPDKLSDRAMVDKAFGLNRAKNEEQLKKAPSMHDDIEGALELLSARLGETNVLEVLNAHSDEQLITARNELRSILFVTKGIGSSPTKGFGLKIFAKIAELMLPMTQAAFLLYFITLKEDEAFQLKLSSFLDALRKDIPIDYQQQHINAYLRSQHPAVAAFIFGI